LVKDLHLICVLNLLPGSIAALLSFMKSSITTGWCLSKIYKPLT